MSGTPTPHRSRRTPTPGRQRRRRRITVALAKDLIQFGVGMSLIVWQGFMVPPADFNWVPMVFGGVIAGVPGAIQLWPRAGSVAPSTDGPSSPPVPEVSLPPS